MLTCRLSNGESPQREWHLDASSQGARRILGSAPPAEWVVQAPGVLPAHVELYFDGQALWVCDLAQKGDVRLNGAPVGEWQQAMRGSQITFGGAVMDVLDSAAAGQGAALGDAAAHFSFPSTVISSGSADAADVNTQQDASPAAPAASKATQLLQAATKPENRTKLILGGAVLVALIVMVAMSGGGGEEPAQPAPSATDTAAVPSDTAPDAPTPSPFDDSTEDTARPSANFATGGDGGVASGAALSAEALAKLASTQEGQAAALVFRGRYREAIPLYERLAKATPDNRAFLIVISVLKHELAKQCVGGLTPKGEPCEP